MIIPFQKLLLVKISRSIKCHIEKSSFGLVLGRDTLRCLALATVDKPPALRDMQLENSANFIKYEVIYSKCVFTDVFH